MRFGNLRIGIRLGISFMVLLLAAIVIGLVAITEMKSLSSLTTKLYQHPYTVSTAMLHIEGAVVKIHRSMKDVALAKNPQSMDAAISKVAEYEEEVYQQFDLVAQRFLGEKAKVDQARQLFANWKPIRDEVVGLMKAGQRDQAAAITTGKGAQHVAALGEALQEFIEFADGKASQFVSNAVAKRDRALLITYLVIGLSVLIGIALAIVMTLSITRPMAEAVRIAGLLAANDLTVDIKTDRKDETGQLLMAMEKMVKNLSDTISINAASAEELSQASSEQASALEETSSSLEEMAAMTKQNADNANEANRIVTQTQKDMAQANDSMSRLTTSMDDISNASEETQKIVKTIDEIAFQTNLLALNAAVEAARAGEAGAGFAVVADEVRNLAMRAADAAKNTASLIEGTVKKVKDGSELVGKTNEAFKDVVAGAHKVNELVAEIATASTQQAEGIEQVNRAAAEMDKVTQSNAANAEEMASSMAIFKVRHQKVTQPNIPVAISEAQSLSTQLAPTTAVNHGREVNSAHVIPLDHDLDDF